MAQTNVGEKSKSGTFHELKQKLEGTHLQKFKVGLIHKKYAAHHQVPSWLPKSTPTC